MRRIVILLLGTVLTGFLLGGCARRASVSSGTIIFLGDSITAGYGLEPGEAYPALIKIKGMTTLNLGVSGSETEDGLQRLKDYFDSGGKPQLVVIALGANDILQGVSPQRTEANLESAIVECRDHDVPVMICGIQIPGRIGTENIFKEVADECHVPLLPDLMQGEETRTDLLEDDDVHPNITGQEIIAQKMQAALLRSFSFTAK